MLKWFLHEEKKLLVNDCLEKGLLSEFYPLPYLHSCASQRKWTGKPSTTQLIDGSRLSYLKLLVPYAVDPDSSAFMVLGTKAHKKLENLTPQKSFTELAIPELEITMIADLLEEQPDGTWWLTDYKTSGSFAVRKALGLVKKKRPAFNEDGTPSLYQKSGHWGKAGNQKMEDYWEPDENMIDIKNYKLQLNKYRKEIEVYFNITISKLRIFFTVRDGGIKASRENGVTRNTYYINIPFMDNSEVDKYFNTKKDVLLGALKKYDEAEEQVDEELGYKPQAIFDCMPSICNADESWNGNRCDRYCPVKEICYKKAGV